MARSIVFTGWKTREIGPAAQSLLDAAGITSEQYFQRIETGHELSRMQFLEELCDHCTSDVFDSKWDTLPEEAQEWVNECVSVTNDAIEGGTDRVAPDLPGLPEATYKVLDLENESNQIDKVLERFDRKNKTATRRAREVFLAHPEYPIQKVSDELASEGYIIKRNNLIVIRSQTKETVRALKDLSGDLEVSLGKAERLLHIELPRR